MGLRQFARSNGHRSPRYRLGDVNPFEMTPERVALGRVAAGSVLVLSSRRVVSWWTGSDDDRASLLVWAIGGRDVALGVGALLALRRAAPARGWFEAAALADAVDVVATLLVLRRAPGFGRFAFLGAALAGVVANQRTAVAVANREGARSPG